jgi:hypothetical protein
MHTKLNTIASACAFQPSPSFGRLEPPRAAAPPNRLHHGPAPSTNRNFGQHKRGEGERERERPEHRSDMFSRFCRHAHTDTEALLNMELPA